MPLATHAGVITIEFQDFGNRHAVLIQLTLITIVAAIFHHVSDASLMRIQPGKQRRPRGAASRRVVKLREPNAIFGKAIQVRCLNLTAVATDVRISHVVGHDQDNIWLRYVL